MIFARKSNTKLNINFDLFSETGHTGEKREQKRLAEFLKEFSSMPTQPLTKNDTLQRHRKRHFRHAPSLLMLCENLLLQI